MADGELIRKPENLDEKIISSRFLQGYSFFGSLEMFATVFLVRFLLLFLMFVPLFPEIIMSKFIKLFNLKG